MFNRRGAEGAERVGESDEDGSDGVGGCWEAEITSQRFGGKADSDTSSERRSSGGRSDAWDDDQGTTSCGESWVGSNGEDEWASDQSGSPSDGESAGGNARGATECDFGEEERQETAGKMRRHWPFDTVNANAWRSTRRAAKGEVGWTSCAEPTLT